MEEITKKKIGERINTTLALKGIKQKELAKILDVSDNVISYFCSGSRTPNTEQIIKIAKHCNVSADYLLGLSDTPTTDIELKAICDYTGLSENAVVNLTDISSELNELLQYFPEDIYTIDFKKRQLLMINSILNNRLKFNCLSADFADYISLLANDEYDEYIVNLSEALQEEENTVKKCDLLDFKLFSFTKNFTELIKEQALKWSDLNGNS